jgi:hypothetical protein
MRALTVGLLALVALAMPDTAHAAVPGSMEITCDIDRRSFRSAAKNETQVTFRLWDAATGGSQCGPDYVVAMSDLVGFKSFTDRFDSLLKRKALRLQAVLGSDATPVQLCSGNQTWLDVSVGLQAFTCDFSSQSPQARRRLHSTPSAQTAQPPDISARLHNSSYIIVSDSTDTPLSFDTERWDTGCASPGMHDPSTNPTRLTACAAGKYLIYGHFRFEATSTAGYRKGYIHLDGGTPLAEVTVPAVIGDMTSISIATHAILGAGQYVELRVYQNSGIPLSIHVAGWVTPEFGMVKLP